MEEISRFCPESNHFSGKDYLHSSIFSALPSLGSLCEEKEEEQEE